MCGAASTKECMKNHKRGKRNLHAEKGFYERLEGMNLDPRLRKLIHKYLEAL